VVIEATVGLAVRLRRNFSQRSDKHPVVPLAISFRTSSAGLPGE
jgi:hypothetical protein